MSKMPKVLKNYNLFVDGRGYAGRVAELTPPKLTRKMEEFRAGGMAAAVDIDMGQEKMGCEFTLKEYDPDVIRLYGMVNYAGVSLRFKGALEADDPDAAVSAVDIVVRGRISEMDFGAWKAGEAAGLKVTVSVSYFKYSVDGEELIEVDAPGMVEKVDGEDRLAAVRDAIGV